MASERARCAYHPKIVLREHFDDRPGPNGAIYTTPNGTFSCLRCDEERDRRAGGGRTDAEHDDKRLLDALELTTARTLYRTQSEPWRETIRRAIRFEEQE